VNTTSTERPDDSSGRSAQKPDAGNSGKYVLLAMVGLGLAGALGTWRFYADSQRRPLELWGSEAAELIVRAETVEALRLEALPRVVEPVEAKEGSSRPDHDGDLADDETTGNEIIRLAGQSLIVLQRRDVSTARGLGHLRVSLVNKASFDWTPESDDSPPPRWDYALRFSRRGDVATVVFASREGLAALAETGAHTSIGPIREGVAMLLAELTANDGP